jgi:hypothetical protein
MSDISEGQGWWIASDGKWYPPELHPSVRQAAPVHSVAQTVPSGFGGSQTEAWQSAPAGAPAGAAPAADHHVGPQFPDLFQKALEGSHLVDNVSVKYADDDHRSAAPSFTSTPVGAASGSSAKRRWRKGG